MAIKIKTRQVGITPRDLIGHQLFDTLQKLFQKHLANIGDPPRKGEYVALVFGQQLGGSVTKVKFPGEFQ